MFLREAAHPQAALGQLPAALLLFGALTLVSVGKREVEGTTAFLAFWSLAGPAGLTFLAIRTRAATATGPWRGLPLAAGVLLVLTFAVGALAASTAAADAALGIALLVGATALRLPLVAACGGTILALAALLGATSPEPDTAVPLATGTVLLAGGGALRVSRARQRSRSVELHATDPAPSAMTLRQLPKDQDRAASVICADAFLDDPAMVALSPRSARRRRAMLRRWFRALLLIARRWGGRAPMGIFAGDELIAVAITYEEGRYPAPNWSAALAAPGMILAGPFASVRSVRWLIARGNDHPRDSHVYLETLAVAPTRQRQGAGARLMKALCDDADRGGMSVVLHTNRPDNLPYYARFAFKLEHEAALPHGPREWRLRRAPDLDTL